MIVPATNGHRHALRPALVLATLAAVAGLLINHRAAAAGSDYLIDVWDSAKGLPNSTVTALAQTRDGYLWIGTHNGLARFDGMRFVNFEPRSTPALKHARVAALFVDAHDTLWINTYDGSLTACRDGSFVYEWQGRAGLQLAQVFSRSNDIVFAAQGGDLFSRSITAEGEVQWQTFKPAERTTGMAYQQDATGTLWYHTRDAAVGYVNGTNSVILPSHLGLENQRVAALTVDRQGQVWAGTDQGIAQWVGDRFINRSPTNSESPLVVTHIFCSSDGGVWVLGNGRLRKQLNQQWVAEASSWGELFGTHTPALESYEDRQGGVWYRHFGQGVFHAKPDGTFRRISSSNGLPGDRVSCWLEDGEGNIWVGVDRGGLVRLRERRFQVIGPNEGLAAPAVASVCEDAQGAIWLGSFGAGLNRWQHGELTSFTLPEGPSRKFVFCAAPDAQGRIWLSAGREDLFVFDDGRIQPAPLNVHNIKATLVDRAGRIWLGKKDGLQCVDNGVLKNFGPEAGIDLAPIHALAEDIRGDLWFGGANGNLYHGHDGKFTVHRNADHLVGESIWAVRPDDDGTVWVGTFRGGLLRFKNGKFTRYTIENGLPSDVICQILDDGSGNLWMGSHNGIFQISKRSLHEFAEGRSATLACATYGTYDGLPSLECSGGYQPSAWRGRDGQLWFATAKGVVFFRPNEAPLNQLPPPVVLEELWVDGKPVAGNGGSPPGNTEGRTNSSPQLPTISSQSALKILPGRTQFEFRFTAPSYVAPDKVSFRYKLEGLDADWMNAGGRRSAQYSRVPPGDYRFRVIACNNDGVWNEAGASIALQVLPEFWETWWFRSTASLALLFGIISAVRYVTARKLERKLERIEQQRAVERERTRIAQDIHDDLGAGLTQIMFQSALARRATPEQSPGHLAQISETAHELVGTMDEIVWAINPENDTLEELVTYVGQFFQEYVKVAGLRCRLELPAQTPSFLLSAEMRHNLFLAVKEALNNVVKHAAATEVSLLLKTPPDGFSFVIKDNGRGFVPGAGEPPSLESGRISGGHGLYNLADRMEKIGGTCVIKSAPGQGTEVELTVMLQSHDQPRRAFKIQPAKATENK